MGRKFSLTQRLYLLEKKPKDLAEKMGLDIGTVRNILSSLKRHDEIEKIVAEWEGGEA